MKVMNELTILVAILGFLALGLNVAVKNIVAVPDELETKFININQVELSVREKVEHHF